VSKIELSNTTDLILKELNSQQKEAVAHGEGPLLIIAGAGTGKTRVITYRIAYLIMSKLAKPEEILALTFTDKAADEMEERVDVIVPYGFTDVQISTFHAFGDRILRDHAIDIKLSADYKVMSQAEQAIFFREHIFELPLQYYRPLSDPTRHIYSLVTYFSRLRDEDISPEEYIKYAKKLGKPKTAEKAEEALKHLELAKVYKAYQELKLKNGVIDFGDQVSLALNLLREHPTILKRYRSKFKYILIDEFQDTNYVQFELVKLLAKLHKNITVVGDDDQSIFKFRGASISNIMGFSDNYRNLKKVVLTKNYRSTQEILDKSYRLIKFNDPERLEIKEHISKKLSAVELGGAPVKHHYFDSVSTEADEVTKIISEKVTSGKYHYKEFAILVRANKDADPFLRAMNINNIPYHFSGSRGLYKTAEVRNCINILRTIANYEDSVSLYSLAGSEFYKMNEVELQKLTTYAKNRNKTLHWVFENIDKLSESLEISDATKAKIEKVISDIIKYTKLALNEPAGRVLYMFLNDIGYLARLAKGKTPNEESEAKNVAKFFGKVREFAFVCHHDRINQFIDHINMMIDAGDDPASAEADFDSDAVNVLTVHKAKGLEFPVVFMVGLVSGKFPSRDRRDVIEVPEKLIKEHMPAGDFHLQEERRLFYVGMTRAMKELFLTSSRDVGERREKKPSQFVLEALDMPKVEAKAFKASALESIGGHAPPPKSIPLTNIIPEDKMLSLSHYQVDDYMTCPLKYKYVHIMKIPLLSHHTIVFGKALHNAVQFYHQQKAGGASVTLASLWKVFEDSWISEGFIDRQHEETRFKVGKVILKRFYNNEGKSKVKPTYIEKEFDYVKGHNRVKGRWDRVDINGNEVVIIDYKSSEVNDVEKAAKRAKDSLQLKMYSLAYKEMFGKVPDRVELHFLESGVIGATKSTQKDLNEAMDCIEKAAYGVRNAIYEPTPGYNICKYCAYNEICPSTLYKG